MLNPSMAMPCKIQNDREEYLLGIERHQLKNFVCKQDLPQLVQENSEHYNSHGLVGVQGN